MLYVLAYAMCVLLLNISAFSVTDKCWCIVLSHDCEF